MEKELRTVTWDKYLGSEIDSMTLFFVDNPTDSSVDEFDVPDDEKHIVFLSMTKENKDLNWIMVVNPQDVADRKNATLPEIIVKVNGETYDLQEIVKLYVGQKK